VTSFEDGFCDELEKLGGFAGLLWKLISKHPMHLLTAGAVGSAGYAGAKAARAGSKRYIAATRFRPSNQALINQHRRLGLPFRQTKLDKLHESINFAPYRGRSL